MLGLSTSGLAGPGSSLGQPCRVQYWHTFDRRGVSARRAGLRERFARASTQFLSSNPIGGVIGQHWCGVPQLQTEPVFVQSPSM